ncbi:MAG: type II toxin-antitoxin system MqsA family antitoxin [Deltaproteobacteria bacterium]|nr:type II toxin-antitoxin system MqsA family antitoxin [Deltaproteobacteria bacterium]
MKKNSQKLCPLCGGDRKKGKTTFTADTGKGVVVVRNVPASICIQCGESWINAKAAKSLESVTAKARSMGAEIEVVAL